MTTSVGSTSTTYTLTGLIAYVDYSIQLAAMNNDGIGPFSNSVVLWSGENGIVTQSRYSYMVITVCSYNADCTSVTHSGGHQ